MQNENKEQEQEVIRMTVYSGTISHSSLEFQKGVLDLSDNPELFNALRQMNWNADNANKRSK